MRYTHVDWHRIFQSVGIQCQKTFTGEEYDGGLQPAYTSYGLRNGALVLPLCGLGYGGELLSVAVYFPKNTNATEREHRVLVFLVPGGNEERLLFGALKYDVEQGVFTFFDRGGGFRENDGKAIMPYGSRGTYDWDESLENPEVEEYYENRDSKGDPPRPSDEWPQIHP